MENFSPDQYWSGVSLLYKWGQSKIKFFNFNYKLNHYFENNFTLTLIILIILQVLTRC